MSEYRDRLRGVKMTARSQGAQDRMICAVGYCTGSTASQQGGRNGFCRKHYKEWSRYVNQVYIDVFDKPQLKKNRDGSKSKAGHVDWNQEEREKIFQAAREDAAEELEPYAPSPPPSQDPEEKAFELLVRTNLSKRGFAVCKLSPHGQHAKGVPDLLIIAPDGRIAFRELKLDSTGLLPHQSEFRNKLNAQNSGVSGVWRPEDWMRDEFLREVEQ